MKATLTIWVRGSEEPLTIEPEGDAMELYSEIAEGCKRAFSLLRLANGKCCLLNQETIQAVFCRTAVCDTSPNCWVFLVGRKDGIPFSAGSLQNLLGFISLVSERVEHMADGTVTDVEGTDAEGTEYFDGFVDLWSSNSDNRFSFRLSDVIRCEFMGELLMQSSEAEDDEEYEECWEQSAAEADFSDKGTSGNSADKPCGCGSGRRFRHCCADKHLNWVDDDSAGSPFASVHDEDFQSEALVAHRMRVVTAMKVANIHPSKIYAYEKTGLLITGESRNLLTGAAESEWNACVAEWELKNGTREGTDNS